VTTARARPGDVGYPPLAVIREVRVWTPPRMQEVFDRLGAAVRCFRVSGLLMRPSRGRWPVWSSRARSTPLLRARGARTNFPGFPGPVSLTVRHTSRRPFASSTSQIAAA